MESMSRYDSVNQEKQQKINRSLVIDLLRQEKLCSRADLAKLSGLKRATITNIINEFMEYDLVIEDGLLEGVKGRRSIGIRINGHKYRTLGVMVTRQYFSIGMIGISGEVYKTQSYKIEEGISSGSVITQIKNAVKAMIELEQDAQVLAIGLAVPGPYKREGDRVIFVTNLVGWDGIEVLQKMQKDFDIPIIIENDANAGVCAQHWFRKKKSEQPNIVYIVAGQGIGCGFISNGELQKGSLGIAGEIGHTSINFMGPKCECGNRGCLEKYCSTIALLENVQRRIQDGEKSVLNRNCSYEELKTAIRSKDPLAMEEYRRACELLAVGVVNMINQINPGDVIIGDSLTEVEPELLLNIVKHKVKEIVRPLVWENLTIEIDHLDYNPILIGAGVIAAQKILEEPLQYLKKE